MALAFDTAQGFGIDKPNGVACPNLGHNDQCTIHANRCREGFSSCVTFDCGGVGQYVTETVFAGARWRDDPALTDPMTTAFSTVREIAALTEMVDVALALDLTDADRAVLADHRESLWPDRPWTAASLAAFADADTAGQIRASLRRLRRYFADL